MLESAHPRFLRRLESVLKAFSKVDAIITILLSVAASVQSVVFNIAGFLASFRVPFRRKAMRDDDGKTRNRLLWAIGWFCFFTLSGLLLFSSKYFDDLARAKSGTLPTRLIEEMTGAYTAALLLPFAIMLARRYRLTRANWIRLLPVHFLIMIGYSISHTYLMAVSRDVVFPISGLGNYDYGIMSYRYVMEFTNDVISYVMIIALVYLFDHYRLARDRELRTAHLETQLAEARLQTLQSQLQPHFLFNALNTISAVIYEDPEVADTMIARLSDFLRHSLASSDAQEVALREELDFLDLYLAIMRPRFETRLNVSFNIESSVEQAMVPKLILQPLVENSIKHGADPRSGVVYIDVRAARENGSVMLQVKDSGPGLSTQPSQPNNGVGLSNTVERLRHLYGADHDFRMQDAANGGLMVEIRLPYRAASQPGNGVR